MKFWISFKISVIFLSLQTFVDIEDTWDKDLLKKMKNFRISLKDKRIFSHVILS